MTSIGDTAGRAVRLNFSPYDNGGNAVRRGASAGDNYRGRQGDDIDKMLQSSKPIQLDAAGMDDEYYRSINGLRQFAIDMRQNHGIDVMSAPDPRNPKAREVHKLWRQALAQHQHNTERLAQGKANQDLLNKEVLAGNISQTQEVQQSDFGPIGGNDIPSVAFSMDPSFLKGYNGILDTVPKTQEEYDQLVNFREQAMSDIDTLVKESNMPAAAASWYKSRLRPIAAFDKAGYDAGLAKGDAERARLYAQAEASRAQAEYRRAKTSTEKADTLIDPVVVKLADIVTKSEGKPRVVDNQSLSGYSFQGKGDYPVQNVVIEDGTMSIFFRKSPNAQQTIKYEDVEEQTREYTTVLKGGDQIRVDIEAEDMSNVIPILFAEKKAQAQIGALTPLYDRGRLPASTVLREFAGESEKTAKSTPTQKGSDPFKSYAESVRSRNPNASDQLIRASYQFRGKTLEQTKAAIRAKSPSATDAQIKAMFDLANGQ